MIITAHKGQDPSTEGAPARAVPSLSGYFSGLKAAHKQRLKSFQYQEVLLWRSYGISSIIVRTVCPELGLQAAEVKRKAAVTAPESNTAGAGAGAWAVTAESA